MRARAIAVLRRPVAAIYLSLFFSFVAILILYRQKFYSAGLQLVLREHAQYCAADCLLVSAARFTCFRRSSQHSIGLLFLPARIARVAQIYFSFLLVASNLDFGGVKNGHLLPHYLVLNKSRVVF